MIPWIQVYSNLIKHPKTYALADELKLTSKDANPNAVAAGMLVSLWLWAAQNATDGDLSKCPPRAIAEAAEYRKSPVTFVAALKKTKWLDNDGKLHDWGEYATLLIELDQQQRERARQRTERCRAKKKASGNDGVTDCNDSGNVTVTPSNAPTIPNHTIPNHTKPYCDDGDGESAREEASESDLFRIGLRAGEYYGIDVGVVSAVEQKAEYLTTRYANRTCSPVDCRNVFTRSFWLENGKYAFDKDAFGLLEYAFEQAEISGFSGQWRYINGILDRLSARDIHTREEAEAFDADRPDKEGGSNGTSY